MKRLELISGQEFYATYYSIDDYLMSLPVAFKIKGEVDIKRLEKVIKQAIEDIDILRIKLLKDDKTGKIYQYFADEALYEINVIKASGDSYGEKYSDVKRHIREILQRARAESLKDTLQWDMVLFDMGQDEYIFYSRVNHIVFDGVSIITLVNKLISEYNGVHVEKTAGFEDFINEEFEKRNSDEYKDILSKARELVRKCAQSPLKITDSKKSTEESVIKEFCTIKCEPFEQYCKEKKLSHFHISLFLFHSSLAALYGIKHTSLHVVIGNRKAKYKNTAGYMFLTCLSFMDFDDSVLMEDALEECKNNYFEASRLAPAICEAMMEEGNPTDFAITYQSYVPESGTRIPFGKAVMTPIADDMEITHEPFNLGCEALSVTETNGIMNIALMGSDTLFPEELQSKWRKAYELASKCLSEKNVTFKDFTDRFEKING